MRNDGPGQPPMVNVEYAKQRGRSRPKSIARFIDGRFSLDQLLAATASSPEAMQAIRNERRALRDAAAEEADRRLVEENK